MPTTDDLPVIDRLAREAAARGAEHLSKRRLAELLGSSSLEAFASLTHLLSAERSDHYALGAYRVHVPVAEPLPS